MAISKAKDNILTGKDLDYMYTRYKSAYKDKAANMKRKGMVMYDTMLSKIEFADMYTAAANDVVKKNYSSEKAKATRVVDYIVERQTTEFTKAQAEAYQKAYKETYNKDITLKEIYKNTDTIKAQLNDLNTKLIMDGIESGAERAAIISAAFFGSPT